MIDFDALTKRLEKMLIETVLECCMGSLSHASRFLRMHYNTLETKIALYQIDIKKYEVEVDQFLFNANKHRNYSTRSVMAGGSVALNEMKLIFATLEKHCWCRVSAAKELGISYRKLSYKINQLKNMGYNVMPNPKFKAIEFKI